MLTFYAHLFVGLLDGLLKLHNDIVHEKLRGVFADKHKATQHLETIIPYAIETCDRMNLTVSYAQAERLMRAWEESGSLDRLSLDVAELRLRILDELRGMVFYCLTPDKNSFFVRDSDRNLVAKPITDIFGAEVVERFTAIRDDLQEACLCYVCQRSAACVFHLMRAAEIGIPKLAKLCEMQDAKPSWGAVLNKAEKLTQGTDHKDLPRQLKPHIEFVRTVVADMRSMQRAWRNKVSHVEDRLVVTSPDFSTQTAYEILVATRVFLRDLAAGLPSGY